LRILHITNFFKPSFEAGGVVNVAYNLSKKLVEKGHEVVVYTTNRCSTDIGVETNKPIYVDGIKVYYFENLRKYFNNIQPLPYYLPLIAKKNIQHFDVIHIHEHRTFLAVFVHYYAKKHGIPYVLHAHGSAPRIIEQKRLKYLFDIFFGYKILRDASKVIAVSNVEVDQYQEMGVSKEKIVVIPNGIDVDSFNDLPEKGIFRKKYGISEKYIVLFFGRLHERKGIDFLIKSYAELRKELDDVVLVLAGSDSGYKTKAETLINDLNLTNEVRFIGYVDDADKLAAYVDADVLVYPSIFEIFGLVPFEAIMCGTPVIVTDDCGCGDLIKEAKCGYLVKYGDVNYLEERMKWVIKNPNEREKLVEFGRNYIKDNLTWNHVIRKMEEIYESCIRYV